MRRPPIKINKDWIAKEIVKAGAYSAPQMILHHRSPSLANNPGRLTGQALLDLVTKIVTGDRLAMTDAEFRKSYLNYIRRTAP